MDLLIAAVAGALFWIVVERLYIRLFYRTPVDHLVEELNHKAEMTARAQPVLRQILKAQQDFYEQKDYRPTLLTIGPLNTVLLPYIVSIQRHRGAQMHLHGMTVVFDRNMDEHEWRIS